jgi:hypothetical protein
MSRTVDVSHDKDLKVTVVDDVPLFMMYHVFLLSTNGKVMSAPKL